MINHQWLETFITLVEVGHFTLTAEKLHMTQPGVSQHIKKIEDQMGVPLINRIGKKFELTNAGEILFEFGLKRKNEEAHLYRELKTDAPDRGDCKFTCSGTMAMLLYPNFLKRQKKHPNLNITLEAAPNELILRNVMGNTHDIGIVTQPTGSSDLDFKAVGVESLCLVLPKKYSKESIDLSFLNEVGFINHPDGFHYADRLLSANYENEFKGVRKLNIKGYVNQINQILKPVEEGIGFTVLPETIVKQFKPRTSLFIPDLPNSIHDKLYLVKKKHRFIGIRYKWFEDEIERLVSI